jgi:hypothetical protein
MLVGELDREGGEVLRDVEVVGEERRRNGRDGKR